MADNTARIVLTAVDNASGVLSGLQARLGGVGTAAATLTTTLSGIGATTALVALAGIVRASANAIDQFNDLRDATGASIESISALDRIARETGGTFDDVSGILIKFSAALKDADPSKGVGAALTSIGLSVEDLKRADPAEALRQVAVATERLGSETDKARIYQELFGKAVKDAAPFLKDLAEQTRLVASASTEAAQQAEEFNKNLSRLQANAEDVARSLANKVIPIINQVFGDLRTLDEKASLASLAGDVISLNKELKELEGRRGAVFVPNDLEQQIAAKAGELKAAKLAFNVSEPSYNAGNQTGAETARLLRGNLPSLPAPSGGKSGNASGATKSPTQAGFTGLSYDEQITQRVGQLFEGADVTKAKEYSDTLAKLDELYFSGAIGSELYDGAVNKLTGSTAKAGKASTELADQQARLAQLLAGTASAALEEQRKDMLLLTAAFEKGTITARQFEEAATARLGLTGPDAKAATESFSETLHGDVKDALSQAFRDTKNPVEAFGNALYNVVLTRVSSGLANSMADSLLGKEGGGGGLLSGVSDWFSNLLSFDGGGYTGTGSRSGGLDGKGGFMAMLHPNESVIDHTKGQGAAGASVTVNVINQSGQAVGAQQRSRSGANGEQIVDVVLTAIGESLANRSGPVARGLESGYGLRPAMA